MKNTKLILAWVLASSVFVGCASTQRQQPSPRSTGGAIGPLAQQLAGTWDLVASGSAGKMSFVDSHELQLRWAAGSLIGVWDRGREWQATAGTVFSDGAPRCQQRRRYWVTVAPSAIGPLAASATLHVGRALPSGSEACTAVLPTGPRWALHVIAGQLQASDGLGHRLRFNRRDSASVPLAILLHGHGKLTGVWTWHHRSVDREGDIKIEHETWHLFQRGSQVEGYYDRVVRVRSRDGRRFVCSNDSGYRNRARFLVKGELNGTAFRLREVSYVIHPGDCDTGRRTLDRYIGMVNGRGSELLLRWRTGGQILQRRE